MLCGAPSAPFVAALGAGEPVVGGPDTAGLGSEGEQRAGEQPDPGAAEATPPWRCAQASYVACGARSTHPRISECDNLPAVQSKLAEMRLAVVFPEAPKFFVLEHQVRPLAKLDNLGSFGLGIAGHA